MKSIFDKCKFGDLILNSRIIRTGLWESQQDDLNAIYDRYEKMSKLYQQTLSAVDLKPKNSDKNTAINNPDEVWGVFQKMVENYSPAEFFKDKTLFTDFNHQDEYYRRHIGRPTNNLVDGTTIMDNEYSVQVTDDDQ